MTTNTSGDQIQYWNETAGPKWVHNQETLDRQIGPLGREAMERLAPRAGERILDVGCGCGDTTLELARRVGPSGSVLGLDVSAPMVEHARRRLAAAGIANARFELGDAAVMPLEPGSFDAAFSRFGVMFFPDPVAAFRNVHAALRAGGRLGFVCWQPVDRNPWVFVAIKAVAAHVTLPPRPGPEDPGPFSFGDPARVQRILAAAGFADVRLEPHEAELELGGGSLDGAIEFLREIGPLAQVLREAPPEASEAALRAVREALAAHDEPGRTFRLGSSTWLVTARR